MDVLPVRLAVEDSSVPLSGEKLGLPVKGPVGQQLSLPCKASGSPEPDKNWILPDGNVIRHGVAVSGGLTIDSNGTLFLPSPSFRDAGHYRCIAINQYGKVPTFNETLTDVFQLETHKGVFQVEKASREG
uniref:Ig-like domain-containing protein n=1 Tax=Gouania willdenowi TaxID=441366 RepID=A0A8C5E514_GOUWI